jgi:peptidoglycan/xylan/chitin deacetylase (PgdA/CDA1 family)
MVSRVRRVLVLLLALLGTLMAGVVAAGGGSARLRLRATRPAPLPIAGATLTQDGQQLSWQVLLGHPFSAAGLRADRRSLCLALQRVHSRVIVGELCVEPRGHGIALAYAHWTRRGAGRSTTIAAAISRSSRSEMTATFLPSAIGIGYSAVRWEVLSELSPASCASADRGSAACPPLITALTGLAKLHTPVLAGCVSAGPSRVSEGPSDVREIALTFDDGPSPEPPAIDFVNLLARYQVPATFFEIGEQIPEFDPHGVAERAMLADGDMIGDHTWTHPDMAGLRPAAQTSEIEETAGAIRRATGGFTPCLWRPPYGDTDPQLEALARSLGFLTVMWSVDPSDWALPGTGAIEERVISAARDGSIVIQHFGGGPRYETLAALPDEITTLRARGYRFVTVAQLLGLKLLYR